MNTHDDAVADLKGVPSPFRAPVVVLASIDSTNAEAWRRAHDGAPAGLVVLADAQTAGRGRQGRPWHSPSGAGVYCSVLLRPRLPAPQVAVLPLLAGLAAWRTVASFLPAIAETATPPGAPVWKWTNDILLAGRKVAGVLVESTTRDAGRIDAAVVGIGINVAPVARPDSITHTATSLTEALGRPIGRTAVAARLLREIAALVRERSLG